MILRSLAGVAVITGIFQSPRQRAGGAIASYDFYSGKSEVEWWASKKECFLLSAEETAIEFERRNCYRPRGAGQKSVFLLGDSHSAYLAPALKSALANRAVSFSQFSAASCTPLSLHDPDKRCADINSYVQKTIVAEAPDVVILFANFQLWSRLLNITEQACEQFLLGRLSELSAVGVKQILLVGHMPIWKAKLPSILAREFQLKNRASPQRTLAGLDLESLHWDERFAANKLPRGVTYLSLRRHLCNEEGCLTRVAPEPGSDLSPVAGLKSYCNINHKKRLRTGSPRCLKGVRQYCGRRPRRD